MTKTSKDTLKGYFKNGELPTGENFAQLIDSMVHFSDFDKHEEEFKEWTERGKISLGAGHDACWELSVDDDERLQVQRVAKDEAKHDDRLARHSTPDLNLVGWTGMTGRIGTTDGEKAFAGEAAELDFGSLQSIKSDGNWYQVVGAPERPCAFEITAAVAGPKKRTESELIQFLDRLLGNAKPNNAVLHAVAAANGAPGARPALRKTAQPSSKAGWRTLGRRLWALLLVVLIVVLVLELPSSEGMSPAAAIPDKEPVAEAVSDFFGTSLGLKGVAGAVLSHPNVSILVLVLLALYLLYVLRMLMFAYRNQRNSIQLVWSRASGSRLTGSATYTLQMRGPLFDRGDAKIYFHITKLWS